MSKSENSDSNNNSYQGANLKVSNSQIVHNVFDRNRRVETQVQIPECDNKPGANSEKDRSEGFLRSESSVNFMEYGAMISSWREFRRGQPPQSIDCAPACLGVPSGGSLVGAGGCRAPGGDTSSGAVGSPTLWRASLLPGHQEDTAGLADPQAVGTLNVHAVLASKSDPKVSSAEPIWV